LRSTDSPAPVQGIRAAAGRSGRLARYAKKTLAVSSWSFPVLLLGLWLVLRTGADRWWPVTVLMYIPRWPLLLPLAVLVPTAVLLRPRFLWLHALALLLIVGPIMGFCVSLSSLNSPDSPGARIRLLTCNVHRQQLDARAFSEFLSVSQPDIVTLQDWTHVLAPELFTEAGWHSERDDELFVASRFPIRRIADVRAGRWSGKGSVACYAVEGPFGTLNLFNVHLASPHEGLQAVFDRAPGAVTTIEVNMVERRVESIAASSYARETEGRVLLAGDFNTPVDSAIYSDEWSRFTNGFSSVGNGFGYTYYTRRASLRIDHILAGPGWHFRRCWIGPQVGSPHRPVVADIEWEGGAMHPEPGN
jgi:vancomycin resistance protein VanJ